MTKIIFTFLAVSLLLAGCSDDTEKNASVNKENVTSAVEITSTESAVSEKVKAVSGTTTEKKQSQTQTSAEINTSATDNSPADSVSSDASQSVSEDTPVSDGELPVIGENEITAQESSVSDNKRSETVTSSSEADNQTITTTTKNTGGVIELPIVPVK